MQLTSLESKRVGLNQRKKADLKKPDLTDKSPANLVKIGIYHHNREEYKKALNCFEQAKEHGNYYAAYCYLTGQGCEQDYKKAVSLLEKSNIYKYNSDPSNLRLWANFITSGPINYPRRFSCCHGNNIDCCSTCKKALTELARCYLYGRGTPVKKNLGIWLLDTVQSNGFLGASVELAVCYRDGVGVKKNLSKSIQLLRTVLSYTPKNPADDAYWLRAKYLYGILLSQGLGVKQDTKSGQVMMQEAKAFGYKPREDYSCDDPKLAHRLHPNIVKEAPDRPAKAERNKNICKDFGLVVATFGLMPIKIIFSPLTFCYGKVQAWRTQKKSDTACAELMEAEKMEAEQKVQLSPKPKLEKPKKSQARPKDNSKRKAKKNERLIGKPLSQQQQDHLQADVKDDDSIPSGDWQTVSRVKPTKSSHQSTSVILNQINHQAEEAPVGSDLSPLAEEFVPLQFLPMQEVTVKIHPVGIPGRATVLPGGDAVVIPVVYPIIKPVNNALSLQPR